MHILEGSNIKKEKQRSKIDGKSYVFWNFDFERILGMFWEGFGKPKSSIFFSFFSMSFFKRGSGSKKNREKMRKKQTFPHFGLGFAVVGRPLGKGKDRGKNTSDRIARKNVEIGQLRFDRG